MESSFSVMPFSLSNDPLVDWPIKLSESSIADGPEDVRLREAAEVDDLVTLGIFEQRELAKRARMWMQSQFGVILELSAHGGRPVWAIRVPSSQAEAARRLLRRSSQGSDDD